MESTLQSNPPVCPVCRVAAGRYARESATAAFKIFKCPACGLEFTDPMPTDEELDRFYADYSDIRANPEIVQINALRNYESLKQYGLTEHSCILDFGCGNGEFVQAAGPNCYGVELAVHKQAGRVFNSLESLPFEKFDFITLWGVLEHLNEPVSVICNLAKRLRPGGHLVITTVDAEGPIPYYYKPPEHVTYWTRPALELLLAQGGFDMLRVQPYEMCQLGEIYLDRLKYYCVIAWMLTLIASVFSAFRINSDVAANNLHV